MTRALRLCRSIHSWMGVILLPWVIVIGATGFYLNHRDLVLSWIGQVEFSEIGFDNRALTNSIDENTARNMAATFWPNEPVRRMDTKNYHGRPSFYVRKKSGTIIVSIHTGHHYAKTWFTRRTFALSGQLLHTKRYWGRVFKRLHEAGWLGGGLGTLLADIVGLCMVVFGVTGLILWSTLRLRRLTNRSQRSDKNPKKQLSGI